MLRPASPRSCSSGRDQPRKDNPCWTRPLCRSRTAVEALIAQQVYQMADTVCNSGLIRGQGRPGFVAGSGGRFMRRFNVAWRRTSRCGSAALWPIPTKVAADRRGCDQTRGPMLRRSHGITVVKSMPSLSASKRCGGSSRAIAQSAVGNGRQQSPRPVADSGRHHRGRSWVQSPFSMYADSRLIEACVWNFWFFAV